MRLCVSVCECFMYIYKPVAQLTYTKDWFLLELSVSSKCGQRINNHNKMCTHEIYILRKAVGKWTNDWKELHFN